MIKYLELALSQEVYEYLEELDEMNWSARGNVLNQYLRNTSIGTTVKPINITSFIESPRLHVKLIFAATQSHDQQEKKRSCKNCVIRLV